MVMLRVGQQQQAIFILFSTCDTLWGESSEITILPWFRVSLDERKTAVGLDGKYKILKDGADLSTQCFICVVVCLFRQLA